MKLPDNFQDKGLHSSGVYAIRCATSGKVYVGSAVDFFHRWRGHYYHLNKGNHHCKHLQRAWGKYGASEFSFAVVETCPPDQLRDREQEHIDAVPAHARYNSSPTAGSVLGFKMPAEAIEKMRIRASAFRHTEETKIRMSEMKRGIAPRPAGFHISEKQKQQMSAARKGKPQSPDHARRSAELVTALNKQRAGQPRTASHRENSSLVRRKLSDEQVAGAKTRYLSGESMTSVAATLGVSLTCIKRAIRGKNLSDHSDSVTVIVRRPLSEEHRKKLSEATKGKPKSPEARKHIREAHVREPWSEFRRAAHAARKAEQFSPSTTN